MICSVQKFDASQLSAAFLQLDVFPTFGVEWVGEKTRGEGTEVF